jgi:peptidoglycan/xylan/chitin deacetylase (PgdA/CDA1 family)
MGPLNTIVVSLLSAFAYASPLETINKRQSSVPYGTVITSCSVPGTFALTFDDGPYIYTDELLNILASNDVKATFFLNGQNFGNIFSFTSTVQRMVNDGHQIGSQT